MDVIEQGNSVEEWRSRGNAEKHGKR